MNGERNGNHITYMWLAGILIVILVAAGGAWANGVLGRIQQVETDQRKGFERTSALEERSVSVDARLNRIEQKIDKLLER